LEKTVVVLSNLSLKIWPAFEDMPSAMRVSPALIDTIVPAVTFNSLALPDALNSKAMQL